MSYIKLNSARNFMPIIDQLIDYPNFQIFLAEMLFQTQQMEKKQLLRATHQLDDEIVKIVGIKCISFDDNAFSKVLGELDLADKSNIKSYPVKIYAMKIGWITNTHFGYKFLFELYQHDSLDWYIIPSLRMTIQFYYYAIKRVLITFLLPIYTLQLLVFQGLMQLKESELRHRMKDKEWYHKFVSGKEDASERRRCK